MDDYRDLVTVSLALFCAGIMLVAGQLTIEHRARNFARKAIETPMKPPTPPMVSHAPQRDIGEPAQGLAGKQPT
ncbi:hypothetical protein [Bradyrhizobium guangdongense]|uniref:Uncharacterized protein n=1 Tax=Bradyrhizobium guangdongense TaxID=1325090 RepID=A0A410V6U1_9BRAD|nr:hypothetical protein [Bradyrhizobium guangdongense]QAU39409.1 hypothetical protein X265_18390 [Bradyrhizobium guangdongense]QOZ60469.1 hypothetical protein XH86_18395 [Bradyrhizobium guangdongense]GGI32237.1 hypothetical protein GCM10010987_68440 [Bradyrhizobium guangdongense]